MYDRIIFDIDGTMTDSEEAVRIALSQLIYEETGIQKNPGELQFQFGVPGVETLKSFGFKNPVESDHRWAELFMQNFDRVTLFEGIEPLLHALRSQGYKLGIVTSKRRDEYMQEFHEPFAVSSLFEGYICANDTSKHKPDAEPMLEYLRRHNATTERTLFLGDTIADSGCAHAAGVDFALALWGASDPDLIPAQYKLTVPGDLLSVLASPSR